MTARDKTEHAITEAIDMLEQARQLLRVGPIPWEDVDKRLRRAMGWLAAASARVAIEKS